jgi:beta-glucosidase/6-phospho-beta-glucosidase/beta-galactosidase
VPTLFHWDLPQPLEDAGGWMNRDTAARFAEYATIVAERLSDRVSLWITLNEPMVVMAYGYALSIGPVGETDAAFRSPRAMATRASTLSCRAPRPGGIRTGRFV